MPEHVTGLREVVDGLTQLGAEVADLDVFGPLAVEATRIIRNATPKRSGALVGTVRSALDDNTVTVTAGSATVRYAARINYGSPVLNIKPRLFMQAADRVLGPQLPQRLEDGITEAIKRAGLE
jgi:hypothetical protein